MAGWPKTLGVVGAVPTHRGDFEQTLQTDTPPSVVIWSTTASGYPIGAPWPAGAAVRTFSSSNGTRPAEGGACMHAQTAANSGCSTLIPLRLPSCAAASSNSRPILPCLARRVERRMQCGVRGSRRGWG
eukprot:1355416-Prymnesium_polylepis.3